MSTADQELRPLHVVAQMAEPVAYLGDGMTFDGILAAALMRDLPYELTSKWPTATRDEPWLRDLELPLARWSMPYAKPCHPNLRDPEGNVWGWHASSVFADWQVRGRIEVRKMPAVHEMERWSDAKNVDISAGRYKAHDLKLPARFATELHWFVVGRSGRIQRLLEQHITSVGRKVGHGNGRVLAWRVEPWHEDWSTRCGSLLTRPMPAGFMRGHIARRGIRAPYWHPSRVLECVVPSDLEVPR
jgi:CRISPR type IV-associated protein Csf3